MENDDHIEVSIPPVAQQTNGTDCGVFAIAFINTLKWLKPERKNQCMEWQNEAKLQNTSLIVQFPVDVFDWPVYSLLCLC